MSKSNGALGVIGKVITYILVVLLVLGIAGMVAYFALRAQGVTYYVEYGGERYVANGDGGSIALLNGKTYNFAVKSLTGENVNYSVEVLSNEANNFGFFVDESYHRFYDNDDANDNYSSVFGLKKAADGFTLSVPVGITVQKAVEEKFGAPITLQSDLSDEYSYFVIVVSSEDSQVKLWFTLSMDVSGVSVDPSEIVF